MEERNKYLSDEDLNSVLPSPKEGYEVFVNLVYKNRLLNHQRIINH